MPDVRLFLITTVITSIVVIIVGLFSIAMFIEKTDNILSRALRSYLHYPGEPDYFDFIMGLSDEEAKALSDYMRRSKERQRNRRYSSMHGARWYRR